MSLQLSSQIGAAALAILSSALFLAASIGPGLRKAALADRSMLDAKVNTLIKVLKFIIAESGFELAARIELRDRKTGRFFR